MLRFENKSIHTIVFQMNLTGNKMVLFLFSYFIYSYQFKTIVRISL